MSNLSRYFGQMLTGRIQELIQEELKEGQMLSEQEHGCCDYHDWGLIHPKTGRVLSGMGHHIAQYHSELKRHYVNHAKSGSYQDWQGAPEWGVHNDDSSDSGGHLFLRDVRDDNRNLVKKAFPKLPKHYSGHVWVNNRKFDNERKAYNHIKNGDLYSH